MNISEQFAGTLASLLDSQEEELCRTRLAEFVKSSWRIIDPGNPLVWGMPMEAICDHLQAVDDGFITRLLMTVPPGFSKSTITNVCFPAWSWIRRPHLRFICTSYSEGLTKRDNDRSRMIISDEWYQGMWGGNFQLQAPNRPELVSNDCTGWKLATSVGGQLLGWRGDRVILDDPNSPKVESDAVRLTTNRWFREVVPSRLNDMSVSAIIVIQQRLHLEDVAGIILGSKANWVHLNIPMEYEPRLYVNGFRAGSERMETLFDEDVDECDVLFWQDWRTEDGELAWPQRFPGVVIEQMKDVLGPTMAAAQLQQRPIPRGGAIIKTEWWQSWPDAEPFPPLSFIVAALDTAYTEDTRNDPSAMTVWGINHDEYGNPRIFLLWAWQEWLELHALVEKVIDTCQIDKREVAGPRFPVHRLLIEDATVGKSVNQELDRILRQRATFGIDLINPRNYGGDKTSRLYSVEHVWAQKIIYAHDRSWTQKVIDQLASVPYTSDDHLADTAAMAIRWLRDCGYAPKTEEVHEAYLLERTFRPKMRPLYPGNRE